MRKRRAAREHEGEGEIPDGRSPFYNNGWCTRDLQALVAPTPPQGVLACVHAGLVINKLSLLWRLPRLLDFARERREPQLPVPACAAEEQLGEARQLFCPRVAGKGEVDGCMTRCMSQRSRRMGNRRSGGDGVGARPVHGHVHAEVEVT